ncbi:Crp/Fnr family transcriptional regulator [Leeuwenhoekiella marinoflava]|uniref:CRP-like cAMP-binding protein n=2 Tax=Leeuwenhoekiella marinoflava TaxID=988 RepID=A0A4Q0PN47_9FLAO|nr:Crp/Fnr family transcriptional regulator [Leeuwenhoekiella marinoflava]RXG31841.1 CRP-like cAMP-binding protein [Leeuwenhoekiella marinoflava]SHF03100.1 cAMP-binding domain of CRP or a regulatory subunit of cAMP-dependent protein kinases [Leeuwenhoekiella marinoflava DSM 3653]
METYKTLLYQHLKEFSGLTELDFEEGEKFWHSRSIKKGDFFNTKGIVCKELGYITKGIFRIYHYDDLTQKETNVFFFSENQFLISFHSFIRQYPCSYYVEALEDSEFIAIRYDHLQDLYSKSKGWEKMGRKLAEHHYEYSQLRMESLLFLTPEKRYVHLLEKHQDITERIPLYHISSYLGIKNPSLSRIRKRMNERYKLLN